MRGIDLYACPGDGGLLNREGAVLIGQEHHKRAFLCFFVLQRHTWGPCRPKKKASPSTPAASSHQDRKKNGNTADDPLYCYAFSLPNVHPLTLPHGPIAQKSGKTGICLGVPRGVPVRPDGGVAPRGGRARVDKDSAFPRGAAGGLGRSHVPPPPRGQCAHAGGLSIHPARTVLLKAWAHASRFSKNILVRRHVAAQDLVA